MLVRHGADAKAAETVRRELAAVDPSIPIGSVRSLEDVANGSVVAERSITALLAAVAAFALALAATGLYGALSYVAGLRTHEIGIRMALGPMS